MDFFSRRKACFFLEPGASEDLTKKLLSAKILFLRQQYEYLLDSARKNELLLKEFLNECLFPIYFDTKLLSALHHLSSGTELEWFFLNKFIVKKTDLFVFGEIKEGVKCLDLDFICKHSDYFFFRLLKLGVINEDVWVKLSSLNQLSKTIGIFSLSDYFYYSHKNKSIIDYPEFVAASKNRLSELKEELIEFSIVPLKFSSSNTIFWKLLNSFVVSKEFKKISEIFVEGQYKYENIRKDKNFNRLSRQQVDYLLLSLGEFNSFDKLYLAAEEFVLFQVKEALLFFKSVFLFFLSQKGFLFSKNNPIYENRSYQQKFIDAIKWLDFLSFLCNRDIDIFVGSNDEILSNFALACEINLSVLLKKQVLHHMFVINFSSVIFISDLISKLKNNPIYKKNYSNFVDCYLTVISQKI